MRPHIHTHTDTQTHTCLCLVLMRTKLNVCLCDCHGQFQLDAETMADSLKRLHGNLDPNVSANKSTPEFLLALEVGQSSLHRPLYPVSLTCMLYTPQLYRSGYCSSMLDVIQTMSTRSPQTLRLRQTGLGMSFSLQIQSGFRNHYTMRCFCCVNRAVNRTRVGYTLSLCNCLKSGCALINISYVVFSHCNHGNCVAIYPSSILYVVYVPQPW